MSSHRIQFQLVISIPEFLSRFGTEAQCAQAVMYLSSESIMARVLREHGQNARRGRTKAPKATRPSTTHIATAPGEVWCWGMTYLPANVMGPWFHLYLIRERTAVPS